MQLVRERVHETVYSMLSGSVRWITSRTGFNKTQGNSIEKLLDDLRIITEVAFSDDSKIGRDRNDVPFT